eukprot:1930991-Alexandrium_andersonii.AAC.1
MSASLVGSEMCIRDSSTSPSSVRSLIRVVPGLELGRARWARTTATALRVQYLRPWSARSSSLIRSLVLAQSTKSWKSSAGLRQASSRRPRLTRQ